VGVFLLTRASQQPTGRSSQAAGKMQPLGSKARVAYVGDEDEQPLASAEEAPSDSSSWQLSVARSAKSGESTTHLADHTVRQPVADRVTVASVLSYPMPRHMRTCL
jgi:hypothetical protein